MEQTILNALLQITVYSAAIFLAVLAARAALQKWTSPALRYALWFLVLLRLCIPVTIESGFHPIRLPQATVAAATAAPDTVASGAAATQEPQSGEADLTVTGAALPDGAQTAVQPERTALGWRQWLLIAWGAGAAAVLGVYLATGWQLSRRIRRMGNVPGEKTLEQYERVRASMDIRGKVPVLLLPDIQSPALTVQFFPKLLLPERLLYEANAEKMAFSMAHELMHYKRGDYLVCLLLILLRAAYWFNPVVWILPHFLRLDMESACDARVVRSMSSEQKLAYVELLLSLTANENGANKGMKGESAYEIHAN